MKVIFYVPFADLKKFNEGGLVRANESPTQSFYCIEAEVGEVEIYQDPAVSTRRLAKRVSNSPLTVAGA